MQRLFTLAFLLAALAPPQAPHSWTVQITGVTARLRGVSAASTSVVWASGAEGTVIRTDDGGNTWRRLPIPGADTLDFRDIDAVDERTAYVLSIGSGEASRIYKTSDAGATWTLQFRNGDPKAFYDAMAFRDARRGFAFSDAVNGAFVILRTDDGGAHWTRIPPETLPPALPGEGAYAASGTNVAVRGDHVWIATTASRVLRSADGGRSWFIAGTPLATGSSAGIFSMAFSDDSNGVAVGGDYKLEAEAVRNAAITRDGGRTWALVEGLSGYRSAVASVPAASHTWVAVGPSGSDVSSDGGRTWQALAGPGFHAIGFAPKSTTGWAVGEKGSVGRLLVQPRSAGA
jgi:photosystem II stability/assembly factor-like uncharacterized protein